MTQPVRTNELRTKLMAGGTAVGTFAFEFFTPGIPYIMAQAGADFCLFDMEHSAASMETIKMLMAASHGADLVPIVRVPGPHDRHAMSRALDCGAMGILAPQVSTRTEAENIVSWCRYAPDGDRGVALHGIGHEYPTNDLAEKMASANARVLLSVLIENPTAIRNIDEIMSVPGIDIAFLGHFDLTVGMGIPGQFDHPDFLKATDAFLAACHRHKKVPGFFFLQAFPDAARMPAWIARGFRCLGFGPDIAVYRNALSSGIQMVRDAALRAAQA